MISIIRTNLSNILNYVPVMYVLVLLRTILRCILVLVLVLVLANSISISISISIRISISMSITSISISIIFRP